MPINPSIASPPPTRRSSGTKSSSSKSSESILSAEADKRVKNREAGLNGIAQVAQLGLLFTRQYADAEAIEMHWKNISHEAALIAENNEKFGKTLDSLSEVGPYTAILGATIPLIMQIAVNHKLIKAEAAAGTGAVSPDILELNMRRRMELLRAKALKEQREAEAEIQRLQADQDADAA